MPRMVKCRKLGDERPGLTFRPVGGELGDRIYSEVSQDAWQMWLKDSVKYVNTLPLGPH
jgi:Fe-S cluster biosynthesis and repair protein YggX